MTDPSHDGDHPDRQLEDLVLSAETVQDLTEAEADDVKGGILVNKTLAGCCSDVCLEQTRLCAVKQPNAGYTEDCQGI
jgi:hypothetical protein